MKRPAFTLIELLVVTATVLVLVTLSAAAVSGARSSQRKSHTRVTISKINDILMSQWRTYPSQSVVLPTVAPFNDPTKWNKNNYKRWNRITGDMPANWQDVEVVASNNLFQTRAQKTYRQFWSQNGTRLTDQYSDGECLFLTVMYGGFAGCLDCAGLRAGKDFRDTDGPDITGDGIPDGDGCPEFIDAWGNPLGFVLWPAGLTTPDGNLFFSNGINSSDKLTYELRPLVFSAGPNGEYGIDVGATSNLDKLEDCGLPSANTNLGSVLNSFDAADNITNFDAEFRR